MKNNRIHIFILLLGLSLLGMLWIQFLWVDNAVKQATEEFDSDVKKSLVHVAQEIEDNSFCIYFYSDEIIPPNTEISFVTYKDLDSVRDTIPFSFHNTFGVDTVLKYPYVKYNYPVQLMNNMKLKPLLYDSSQLTGADGQSIINQDITSQAIDVDFLDSLLIRELSFRGIETDYSYSIVDNESKQEIFNSAKENSSVANEAMYEQRVFQGNSFYPEHSIFVTFPNKTMVIWNNLWLVIGSSIVLLSILIVLFFSFIKMIYSQKKLSETRMDFMNNMTHEFKTPISNISLALNALKGKVTPEENQRYLEIIDEEKDRLSEGIDLVLTTALLDKNELSLSKEEINVHELLNKVAKHNELRLVNNIGSVHLVLNATKYIVELDEHHILNVFDNLLDNAIKYSDEKVQITITTRNIKSGIEIVFKDTGYGIEADDLKQIFDKYFRVSTQNRYETKGFGIGLYYVKMIVNSHGGNVSVESKVGKGTVFTIYLPY